MFIITRRLTHANEDYYVPHSQQVCLSSVMAFVCVCVCVCVCEREREREREREIHLFLTCRLYCQSVEVVRMRMTTTVLQRRGSKFMKIW